MKQSPPPRTVWTIRMVEHCAINAQLFLEPSGDKPLTSEQAEAARQVIDQAFAQPGHEEWLESAWPWVVHDELRIWWRGISASRPESRALVARLNKTNQP